MIEWLYVFASMLFFGLVNFNRKLLTKGIGTWEAVFWESLGFWPLILFMFLTTPLSFPPNMVVLCLGSALLYAVGMFSFFRALREGFVSAVATVTNLNGPIGALLAFIVLSEAFSGRLLLGIVAAAGVVFLLGNSKAIKPGNWLVLSLLSAVLLASKSLVDKSLAVTYSPLFTLAVITLFSTCIYFVPFAIGKKKATLKRKAALAGNGLLLAAAAVTMFLAFSALPLSIVLPVINMNTVITVFLGAYLLKERLDRRALLAVVLALVSIWLVAG
jgi:drug/metabolite transporter (DMT)-like permease